MTDRCPSCGSPVSASGESLVTREGTGRDVQEALKVAISFLGVLERWWGETDDADALRSLLLDPQPEED